MARPVLLYLVSSSAQGMHHPHSSEQLKCFMGDPTLGTKLTFWRPFFEKRDIFSTKKTFLVPRRFFKSHKKLHSNKTLEALNLEGAAVLAHFLLKDF